MIKLIDFTNGKDQPFGNIQGRETFKLLLDFLDNHPEELVIELSLFGIKATDASFPRESVLSIAKQFKGERWIILRDFSTADLLDNWDYAAKAKDHNMIVVKDGKPAFIGPKLTDSNRELLLFVFSRGSISTATVAKSLDISVQNASTRLKKLVSEGLIMRSEETALSGGIEFMYKAPNFSH